MKTRKQMRNIFIKHIDNLLIRYYKEIDFETLVTAHQSHSLFAEERSFCTEAMWLIDLMKELELVSDSEHSLLRDVYMEYFSI